MRITVMTLLSSMQKRILPGMLAVAAVSILTVSGRYAYGVYRAELLANNVRATIESWDPREGVSTQESWDEAHEKIVQASAFAPNVPEYHRLEGMLYEWYAFSALNLTGTTNEIFPSYKKAADAYQLTIIVNPSEAMAWSRYARMQARALQWNENLKITFRMAMRLGSYLRTNQEEVALVASIIWSYLATDKELLEETLDFLAKAITQMGDTRKLSYYVKLVNAEQEICSRLPMDLVVQKAPSFCKQG